MSEPVATLNPMSEHYSCMRLDCSKNTGNSAWLWCEDHVKVEMRPERRLPRTQTKFPVRLCSGANEHKPKRRQGPRLK